MIDFHCHLDLYPNPRKVVAICVEKNIYILSVTTVPSAFEGTSALIPKGGRIRTALGLHPELVASRAHELPLFEKLLPRTKYVGEVGLDGSKIHRDSLNQQKSVLQDILKLCSRAGGKIISLHSRGACGAILDILGSELSAGKFVLHWYLGSRNQIEQATELGCWFSVGPAMLSSQRGLDAIKIIPRNRVIPESDGPFGMVKKQPIMPWETYSILPKLADLWNMSCLEAEAVLLHNFKQLLTN